MKFALSTLDTKQGSSGLFVFTSYQLNKCPLNFSSDNAASSVFFTLFFAVSQSVISRMLADTSESIENPMFVGEV